MSAARMTARRDHSPVDATNHATDCYDDDFAVVDAGASNTIPVRAGELKKGSHVVISGHPCKVGTTM